MLQLRSSNLIVHKPISPESASERIVVRVSTDISRPEALRGTELFVGDISCLPDGYIAYGVFQKNTKNALSDKIVVELPESLRYLSTGDVVALDLRTGALAVLYRRNSLHNSFLVTEQCNHYCLMCSQPPKSVDDSWLAEEILSAIPLISPETNQIGLTGGEPTILGTRFLDIVRRMKSYLPQTALHVLSNGRRFADTAFSRAYAEIDHPKSMVGIPVYSDIAEIHNYVVQAESAFDETIRGIINLKRVGQRVEVRVVIHKQTYERLPQLAEYIARNLTMVDHVALMGLEIMGFTRANLDKLWVDPTTYASELVSAVEILSQNRMNVSIYNHPLCLIPKEVWPFARQSISDWKNEYIEECEQCDEQERCGGFFASAKFKRSEHIKPFIYKQPDSADL